MSGGGLFWLVPVHDDCARSGVRVVIAAEARLALVMRELGLHAHLDLQPSRAAALERARQVG